MNEYFLIEQRNMEEELACVDETASICAKVNIKM